MNELTVKQRLFVENYLQSPNATQAAIKAGYSKKTAASQGERLLRNVEIAALVTKRIDQEVMSANEVLSELADIAKADWREFVEIRYDRDGKVIDATLRLSDKIKSLELIGKHHKLFTDKQEITGKDGGAIESKIIVEVVSSDNKANTNK